MTSANKRYIIMPREQRAVENGITSGKRHIDFGDKTVAWTSDSGEAAELEAKYGKSGSGDVWVDEDPNLTWHHKHDGQTDGRNYGVHRYTFGPSRRYADAWNAFVERRDAQKAKEK